MSTSTDTMTGITTIFTPPEDCKTSWTYEAESYNGVTGGLLIQIVNENDFATSCFPDGFEGYGRQPIVQVYSPGVCPSGYATQGESDVGGTTTGICCQSGYTQYGSINSVGSSSGLFRGCISTFSGVTTVSARANQTDLTTTVVTGPLTLWGQQITVEYQQKDLTLLEISSSPTSTRSSSSQTSSTYSGTATNATSSPSTSATPSPISTGLSTGAKAGIGIGVALGFLLLLALGIFLIKKRRKSRLQNRPAEDAKEPYRSQMAEPQAARERRELDSESYRPRGELDGSPASPMNSTTAKYGSGHMSELE